MLRHILYDLPPWHCMLINLVNTKYALNRTWFHSNEIDHFMHSVLWSSSNQTDRQHKRQ